MILEEDHSRGINFTYHFLSRRASLLDNPHQPAVGRLLVLEPVRLESPRHLVVGRVVDLAVLVEPTLDWQPVHIYRRWHLLWIGEEHLARECLLESATLNQIDPEDIC